MGHFTAFRARLLSILAAAGVAQACGGTVVEEAPTRKAPPVDDEPGCLPVPDLPARIAAAERACGSGIYCFAGADTTTCFGPAELGQALRDCGTPLRQGSCPAPTDLTSPSSCTVLAGEAQLANGQCCYPAKSLSCAVPGRPLRVNGALLLPEVMAGAALPSRDEPGLDEAARRALTELWSEGARYEYASVASFARTTLQLMALGAPSELVAAAQAASLDEVEHARSCFALASRFGGRELRAGPLPIEAFAETELAELAAENVIGGCVGETVAALTAVEQLGVATDPEVRAVLGKIAEDETRHAELAWQIAAWAWSVGGAEVRARMLSEFERALAGRPGDAARFPLEGVALEGHGQLTPGRERAIRNRILGEVVAPCARALLAV